MSRYRAVCDLRSGYGVTRLCRVLGVSRSGFYAWKRRSPSARQVADDDLYGFRNLRNYRLRLLLHCGGVTWQYQPAARLRKRIPRNAA